MKEKTLYLIWLGLYILCAGLGFIPEPAGFSRAVFTIVGILFFLPGGMLLYRGLRAGNRAAVVRIRIICAVSLAATLVLLVANLLSITASEVTGTVLYVLLGVLSSPMYCCQSWVLSLFLWSCLFTGSFLKKVLF